jgi:hypothetical protein
MFRSPRMSYFPPRNINLLSALVARVIAETVTLGRTFGYRFPAEYDVGFKLVEDVAQDGGATITIRVGQTKLTYHDRWHGRGTDWLEFLQLRAYEAVHRWAAENPAYLPAPADVKRFVEKMEDAGWREEAIQRSKTLVKDVTFTYPWGKLTEY